MKHLLPIVAITILFVLAGCSTDDPVKPGGSNSAPVISAKIPLADSGNVEYSGALNFGVTATDPDNDPLTYSWSVTGGTIDGNDQPLMSWTAPATVGRHTVTVTVSDGKSHTVIQSWSVSVGPRTINRVPVISTKTPDTESVNIKRSGTLSFSVTATDPDNDTLTYSWSASGGAIAGNDQPLMTWTAPATTGRQTVTITVSDGKSHSTTQSWSVGVGPDSINSAPVILTITPDTEWVNIERSGILSFSVTATDPENDPLTYTWSVSGGTISSNGAPSVIWTAPATTGQHTVSVIVSDSKSPTVTQSWSVDVGPDSINSAPVISSSTPATDPDVGCSEVATFSVTATDPDNDPLTYAWNVTGGTMTGNTTATMTWTSPATRGAHTVKVTVSDGKGHSDTASWSIAVGLVKLHGTISTDSVLNNPANDYYIDNDLTITGNMTWGRKIRVRMADNASVSISSNGKLTIQEGVLVTSGVGCYIQAGYVTSGTLIAQGSDSLPVTFTKSSGVANWGYSSSYGGGILLYSNITALTSLDYCIIESATHGIYIDEKSPVITRCKIRNNAGLGINFDGAASPKDSASFAGNEITGNGGYPISIEPEGITKLAGTTVITGNTPQAIEVRAGEVTVSGTWRKHSVPYAITEQVRIRKATSGVTITVQPGTVFKCDVGAYIEVGYVYPATFIAEGTDSNRIVFTASTAGTYWGYAGGNIEGGIWIGDKATTNTSLKYCVIEKATTGIYDNIAKITVSNCWIRDNKLSGIKFDDVGAPKDSASFVNDTITGNGEYGIEIEAPQLGYLSGTGSVAGNTLGGIYVSGGAVATATHIWKKHDAAYIIAGKVSVAAVTGAAVTIRPGCRFLMATDAYLEIGYAYPGTVIAEGTATDSIKFTGMVSGISWGYEGGNIEGGIWIGDKATTNTSFKFCDVGNATSGFYVRKSAVAIQSCTIHDCSINAITLDDAAPQTNISGNTYKNNTGGDVVVQ